MGVFDAARLAAEGDVLVVTVNYRLGALGYLVADADSDAADSNCGLRDQLAALQWVHAHAAEFGGDPARITVFGESAGAGSTLHLCVARTPPPVRRAIVQSGEPRTLTLELAHRVRDGLGAQLHVAPDDFDALRALPVDALDHGPERGIRRAWVRDRLDAVSPHLRRPRRPRSDRRLPGRARRATSTSSSGTRVTSSVSSSTHGREISTTRDWRRCSRGSRTIESIRMK